MLSAQFLPSKAFSSKPYSIILSRAPRKEDQFIGLLENPSQDNIRPKQMVIQY